MDGVGALPLSDYKRCSSLVDLQHVTISQQQLCGLLLHDKNDVKPKKHQNDCDDHYHMQWHEYTAGQDWMVLTNDSNKCDNNNNSSSVFTW